MTNNEELNFPFVNRKMLDFEQGAIFSLLVTTISPANPPTQLTIQGATKNGPFKCFCDITPVGGKQTFTFRLTDIPIFLSTVQSSITQQQNGI